MTIYRVMRKVAVDHFYKTYAGLFFLALAFCFGFMRAVEHIALAGYFVSMPVMTMIPGAIWIAYTVFVGNFNLKLSSSGENTFLQSFSIIHPANRLTLALRIVAAQLFPIIAYGLFLIAMAFQYHKHDSAVVIIALLCTLIAGSVSYFDYSFRHCSVEHRSLRLHNNVRRLISRSYPAIIMQGLIRRQTLSLLSSKAISVLLLFATVYLYENSAYDVRLLVLSLTIACSLQVPSIFEWHHFEYSEMSFYHLLPLSKWKRYLNVIAAMFLLFLPEIGMIIRASNLLPSLQDAISSCVYALSIPLFWYSFEFMRPGRAEITMSWVYLLAIILFILVLASVPIFLLSGVIALAGVLIFSLFCHGFERW